MDVALYRRRAPEESVLHRVVRENLEDFFRLADGPGATRRGIPRYVRNAFRRYLDCGILAKGFARVRCPDCGYDTVVAFSCKERGLCPSCAGRRMADTAAHLADNVFPRLPVRQWVLSVPRQLRYIMARDPKVLSGALKIFVSEVFRDMRRRAGVKRATEGFTGAVTGIQRFGGALNLNIHFHTLALDGVWVRDPETGQLRFRRLEDPAKDDLDQVLSRSRARIIKYLLRKGFTLAWGGGEREDSQEGPSVFEMLKAASIREMIALSSEARKVALLGGEGEGYPGEVEEKPFSTSSGDGFSLQAGVRIKGTDPVGLERLCRYILRPPFAEERLSELPDGRLLYKFRRRRPDGRSHVMLTPLQLMEKLAALVPPPRSHLLTYHGVLAPNSKLRPVVTPPVRDRDKPCHSGGEWRPRKDKRKGGRRRPRGDDEHSAPPRPRRGRRRRTPWAELLRRSMNIDVLSCPKCNGRMAVIACITEPPVVRKILRAMGLPDEPPGVSAPRPPPQTEFEFVQDRDHLDEAQGLVDEFDGAA